MGLLSFKLLVAWLQMGRRSRTGKPESHRRLCFSEGR